ncbi:chemotaxis response regulator protein-glutamate methylesterase [Sphingobium jiangsuense]|uniref:Protein-glutamate methylesterase/protein-glutamine glutaminase n=1 Tax=Sphingobium jiangsuense TaxID=870476 RepID=A0A7W6BDE2_9SPHN|nr:chemotaxis-specific protein-glutamate methyltransferase CheB [Sphingobium jiangsuense]MBB3924753.1 two-component system chemotaxis response regulator CheB [Sphingobium jiangsuense]GLT00395.1 chemotaxis response regulator protein-glutamate methylesterase [Sphingobium jiangsuense]
MAAIKVLVVDDSITMRALFSSALEQAGNLVVVGAAANADEARDMIAELRPDVVTLDIEMPGMNGIDFLEEIMTTRPMPVVMLSTLTEKGAEVTLRALELGAVDCFHKPARATTEEFASIAGKLCKLVATAAKSKVKRYDADAVAAKAAAAEKAAAVSDGSAYKWNGSLVAISASTGGGPAVIELLSGWPVDCPPTIVLQQLEDGLAVPFASRLNKAIAPEVKLAEDGMALKPGHVYVLSHPDRHGLIDRWPGGAIRLIARDPVNGMRPSADLLLTTIAKAARDRAVGVILSGAGTDGAAGMLAVKQMGGLTLCQDKDSAMLFEASAAAIAKGAVEAQLPLPDLAARILAHCEERDIAA